MNDDTRELVRDAWDTWEGSDLVEVEIYRPDLGGYITTTMLRDEAEEAGLV